MYFIGGDHYNNRIPHKDLQIFCHRVYAKIDWNLSDDELRHKLYYNVFKTTGAKNDFYTRNDTSLKNFLADCKANNIVPIVNNNATYLDLHIPVGEYARRSKIIDDLMYEVGFDLGYQALMNEPGKRYLTFKYVDYVNAAKAKIKHYKVIAGNDEYNMLDWNYLLDNGEFDILGVHPLSSLSYPPNWNILINWKVLATAKNKPIIITEGGSWFKSYFSLEGWTVIKDLILKAKFYEYLATCIVLLDINKDSYPKLGFRRFTKDYKSIISVSKYWDKFINLVNGEGKKYIPAPIIERKDGMIIPTQVLNSKGYLADLENELLWKLDYLNEEDVVRKVTQKTVDALKIFQNDIEHKYPNIMIDGKCGRQTFRYLIQEISDSIDRDNYRFALEIYASPTK